MIGPKFRSTLRVVAYVLLASAVVSGVAAIIDHLTGRVAQENLLVLVIVTVVAMANLAFQGAVLLALLSIDERLQRKI